MSGLGGYGGIRGPGGLPGGARGGSDVLVSATGVSEQFPIVTNNYIIHPSVLSIRLQNH